MASGDIKVTVIMNGQRINRSAAFLCRSWAEQCPVHGPKYVSDGATAAAPGTVALKALRSGALFQSRRLLSRQTHFLHRYRLHNGHICLLETFSHGDGFTKGTAFLPRSCPHATASRPSLLQLPPSLSLLVPLISVNPLKSPDDLPHLQGSTAIA